MSRRPGASQPHPLNPHIGQRLRARRMALGLNQTELGNRVGITFQQVQKYEKGVNALSPDRLLEFAQALDVPYTYFFEDYDPATAVAKPAGDAREGGRLMLHLMRLVNEIPRAARAPLLALVVAMANQPVNEAEVRALVSADSQDELEAQRTERPRD